MQIDVQAASRRIEAARAFLPGFVEASPVLSRFAPSAGIVMHGSTTLGFADAPADLDVWMIVDEGDEQLSQLPTRFFEFKLDGVKGHVNLESMVTLLGQVEEGDLPLIYELRRAVIFDDPRGIAARLIDIACRPMSEAFRRARFMYYYVEMRGEHRAVDNPIDRGDPVAILLSVGKMLERALQASMLLDGEPFPYVKWLDWASRQTPTGKLLAPHVDELLNAIGHGALHEPGPERDHRITRPIRAIRQALVDRAIASGNNEPWLREWWFSIPQSRAAASVRWTD